MSHSRALGFLLVVSACAPGTNIGQLHQGIEGRAGTYEFAADAPWRMEPTCLWGACSSYDAIPIQIAIHDADIQHLSSTSSVLGSLDTACAPTNTSCLLTKRRLTTVRSLTVTELPSGTPRSFGLGDLHEVERTVGPWHVQSTPKPPPLHQLCRHWANEDCTGFGSVEDTSEWHATLRYAPSSAPSPGSEVRLKIELHVAQRDLFGDVSNLPDAVLTQHVVVHYGEAPLPRFSDDWAYGDLHYHSQGTDNEGESAHSYRGVVYALAALGLDFSFASDHASASEQIMAAETGITNPLYYEDTLRDTDELRFAVAIDWLNAPGGANASVTSMPRLARQDKLRVPQLFMGGEVDVIPETAAGNYQVDFGDDKHFDYNACDYPVYVEAAWDYMGGCHDSGVYALIVGAGDRWLLKDLQGVADASYFARQHLLNLPFDSANKQGFIASHTSKFGGATRRLREILAEEDAAQKGVIFLAHPMAGATGNDLSRMAGPDLIPYSQVQLDEAFASPHVLGLQLWNEDVRLSSGGVATGDPGLQGVVTPWDSDWVNTWDSAADPPDQYGALHDGASAWDRMLRKGLNEQELAKLGWLAPGQPRRVFMAGGSDAHGDLNYRRTGYMLSEISGFTDTAIGKPRNLVFVGRPEGAPLNPALQSAPLSQRQVVAGLQSGQFTVTDGPALRIAWDVNGNGQIDEGDVPMGGQVDYDTTPPPLLVEWLSTPEFGAVNRVDLYVGVRNEELGLDATYTVDGHAVRGVADHATWLTGTSKWYTDQTTRRRYVPGTDGYSLAWDGPSLRLTPGAGEELRGVRSLTVNPSDFPLGVLNGTTNTFDNSRLPDRMYVRAFAQTSGWRPHGDNCVAVHGECIPRLAYTNPLWARTRSPSPMGTLVGIGGKCLEEMWRGISNGTTVLTYDCAYDHRSSQRWSFHPETGEIFATGLHKRLDLLGWNSAEGASVGIWDRDGAANQTWRFDNLEIHQSGLALSVFSSNTADGAAVGTWGAYGYPDQKWRLTAAGEIRGLGDKCLDVSGWGTADGTPADLYTCNGAANQKWTLAHGGRIVGWGGKCLTIATSGWGVSATLSTCNGSAGQVFSFEGEVRDWADKCLDVYGGRTDNGTPVLSYTCSGAANQHWSYQP